MPGRKENDVVTGFSELVSEIMRAYRVLGMAAACQNDMDICAWYETGWINEDEKERLTVLNNNIEKHYSR